MLTSGLLALQYCLATSCVNKSDMHNIARWAHWCVHAIQHTILCIVQSYYAIHTILCIVQYCYVVQSSQGTEVVNVHNAGIALY